MKTTILICSTLILICFAAWVKVIYQHVTKYNDDGFMDFVFYVPLSIINIILINKFNPKLLK